MYLVLKRVAEGGGVATGVGGEPLVGESAAWAAGTVAEAAVVAEGESSGGGGEYTVVPVTSG